MSPRRFLLLHITLTMSSGHARASLALEEALRRLEPDAHIARVDAFQYTSGFVRWAMARSYFSLIRHQPDVWEYLYDNPAVHRQVYYFRSLLHRYHAHKLERLLATVRPDVIACTQAYPCGIVADFKRRHGLATPLVGVLTDYAPHLYWFHDAVDAYVVPSEQVKRRFLVRGVAPDKVHVLGIPVDPRFLQPVEAPAVAARFGLDLTKPILLIMGGGSGFGQLREIVCSLDTLPQPCQLVVLTGMNTSLLRWLKLQRFRHRVVSLAYTPAVPELMHVATLLVSKPGGLTTSEALAKRLPLVMINPIPGQEAYNARFLLSQGAAVQAGPPHTIRQTIRDLLESPDRLEALRRRIAELAHPTAALDAARLIIQLADGREASIAERCAPSSALAAV